MDSLSCKNCGIEFSGHYCPQCSQRVVKVPMSFGPLNENILELIDFNKGFFHTTKVLFKSPNVLINDYLNGRTRPYNNPIRYFLTVISLIILAEIIYRWTVSKTHNVQLNMSEIEDQVELIFNPLSISILLITPIYNFVSFRDKLTLIEHFVISLFQVSMYYIVTLLIVHVWYVVLGYEGIIYSIFAFLIFYLTLRFNLKVFEGPKLKIVLKSILYLFIGLIGLLTILTLGR
jgi:hypothetical protein